MRAAVSAAGFHALIFAGLCAALVAAFVFLPGLNIKWYPSIVMSLIALSPIFYSKFTADRLYSLLQRRLSGPEHVGFALLVAGFVVAVAGLCEAMIVYLTYGKASGVSFADIILAPLSERYSLTGSSGLSFSTTALLAGGLAGLIFVPIRVRLLATNAARQAAGRAPDDTPPH